MSSTAFGTVVSGMPLPLGVPPNFFLKQDAKHEYDITTGTGVSTATLQALHGMRAKVVRDLAVLFTKMSKHLFETIFKF